jgi:UV DNA damage endonuclease
MHMSYSLCCISNILKEKGVSFSTMTKKRFFELERSQAIKEVSRRTLQNIKTTLATIEHCSTRGWNYRTSCNLFPLITLPEANLVFEEYYDYVEITDTLELCKQFIQQTGIRISNHPDQFVVLASENSNTVRNSIRELEQNAWVMDKLGAKRDYTHPINLHINKSSAPEETSRRFLANLATCSDAVKSRLVIENEDKGIWNVETITTHFNNSIPVTFDNLHHKCNPGNLSEHEAFDKCFSTWGDVKPLFHYSESEPGNKNPRAHAQTPINKPNAFDKSVDWEIELKNKDYALMML